jgi:ABC-type nitrate/sulfonate/bicarbonate transport system substrate-binding protein
MNAPIHRIGATKSSLPKNPGAKLEISRAANVKKFCQRFMVARASRAVLAGLILLYCFGQARAAEKAKLTIGYSTTGPTAVGLWMAKEIGAFGKYGVEPNFVFISSSPVMVPALIGGDVQCAIAGANAVIAAALGGAPIVAVASLANRPYLRLWVQPEFNRIEELRGKTFGVSRFGATRTI